jgi:hypothetical protein
MSFFTNTIATLEKHDQLSEDQMLVIDTANQEEISEYQVFVCAGVSWRGSSGAIDDCFVDYIKDGNVPWFVRDFCRKALNREE